MRLKTKTPGTFSFCLHEPQNTERRARGEGVCLLSIGARRRGRGVSSLLVCAHSSGVLHHLHAKV